MGSMVAAQYLWRWQSQVRGRRMRTAVGNENGSSCIGLAARGKFSPVKKCSAGEGAQGRMEFHTWRVLRPDRTRPGTQLSIVLALRWKGWRRDTSPPRGPSTLITVVPCG